MKKRNWRLMLRRVLNLVFSRIVVTGVLLLLQAFWLFALFYWLADYAKWFGGVGVARPQKGAQDATAGAFVDQQRVVHVLAVKAVEADQLLLAVGRIVGAVQLDDEQ